MHASADLPSAGQATTERAKLLAPFGFTERQARFLATVMLHSGVFVGRQYVAFAGITHGQKVRDFIERSSGQRSLLPAVSAPMCLCGGLGRERPQILAHRLRPRAQTQRGRSRPSCPPVTVLGARRVHRLRQSCPRVIRVFAAGIGSYGTRISPSSGASRHLLWLQRQSAGHHAAKLRSVLGAVQGSSLRSAHARGPRVAFGP
jgi:hypothetical protein